MLRTRDTSAPKHDPVFWFICLGLVLATLGVFWSVGQHDFVNLDDQVYITDNDHIREGVNWTNVKWAFGNFEAGFWHPLTWLSIMLDCQFYGLKPGGHHVTSLLFHTANTALLFILLLNLTSRGRAELPLRPNPILPCVFVAALFALHPLHVETVAWASDRKDVLSTFFLLLALLAYVKYAVAKSEIRNPKSEARSNSKSQHPISQLPSSIWYFLSLFLFALGLMSKPMLVTVPFVLLLVDFWPLGRFALKTEHSKLSTSRLLFEKVPFLILSVVAGLLTIHAEKGVGAVANSTQFPLAVRAGNALVSCCIYLRQLVWPRDLAVYYPYPMGLPAWQVAAATCLLTGVTFVCWTTRRSHPYLLAGWLWYLITLTPVSGIIQIGGHAHADRYTYVPLIGVFVMVAWGLFDLFKERRGQAVAIGSGACIVVGLCAAQASEQVSYWRNSETLFRHTLAVTSPNAMAHYCLGLYLSRDGRSDEAIDNFKAAIDIDPRHAEAHDNLGVELAIKGNMDQAIGHFREAIKNKPSLASAHSNLGMALASRHQLDEGIKEYETSLQLKPNEARVHSNLGNALDDAGKPDRAVTEYLEAVRLEPNNTNIRLNLAMTLAKQGKRQDAIFHYNEVLRLNPADPEARRALQQLSLQPKF